MLLPGALYLLNDQANRDNSRWADFKLKSPAKLHPYRDHLIRSAQPVSAIKQRWLLRPIGFANRIRAQWNGGVPAVTPAQGRRGGPAWRRGA